MIIKSNKQKFLYCLIIGIAAILCMLFQSCSSDDDNKEVIINNVETTHLTGRVLDGPVLNAYIRFLNPVHDIIITGESDQSAKYDVQFSENASFPIHIEMLDGNDYLTDEPVVLTLTSIAMNDYQEIANITPLTHLIYLTAQKIESTVNNDLLEDTTHIILNHFGFRHPENINPISSDVIGDNTADILITNQLVIELMKRVMGENTAKALSLICKIWAEDLKDGNLDGQGINNQLEQQLSQDLTLAKVCLKTHIFRLILFTEMYSNSISITNRKNKADMEPDQTREKIKNCMCKMGLTCDEAESQLNNNKINNSFISELRHSTTMLASFCEKDPQTNDMLHTFESLNEMLENIQENSGSVSLTTSFAKSFNHKASSFYHTISSYDDDDLQGMLYNTLEEIKIITPYTSFSENSSFKLLVNGKYGSGTTKDLSLDVIWNVYNSDGFVTNIKDNHFLAVSSGEVMISAVINGKTDYINLIIVPIHPSVISHKPKDNEYDVHFDRKIEINFSKPIRCEPDPFSIVSSQFDNIDFTINCTNDNKNVEIIPDSNLLENKTYSVSIMQNLVDISGNPIQEPYEWSFHTQRILPTVTEIIPAYTQNVSTSTAITAFFSEPIECSSINDNTMQLLSAANKVVSGTCLSITENSNICTAVKFIPDGELLTGEQYTVRISKEIIDLQGNKMSEDKTWRFLTDIGLPYVESHVPATNAQDISIPSSITVTFSEPVYITKNCIVLESSIYSIITGNVSCDGVLTTSCANPSEKITKCNSKEVVFTPYTSCVQNTVYTVTVNPLSAESYSSTTIKIRDHECLIFPETYSWTFQTFANPELSITPFVALIDKPINHTILNNTGITFTFNEPMALSQYMTKISFDNQYTIITAQGNDGYTTYALSYLFKEDTSYTLTILDLTDKNGHPYLNNNGQHLLQWHFQTAQVPEVIEINPQDNDCQVPLDLKSINITFSEPVQNKPVVKLISSSKAANITLLYASHTAANTHFCYSIAESLSESTRYTLMVMADSVINNHEIQMANNFISSFTSINIAPKLVDFYPGDTSKLYPVDTIIRLTCSENVRINQSDAFCLTENDHQVNVASNIIGGNSVVFTPINLLKHKTTYCVNIQNKIVTDIALLPAYLDLTGTNIEWCFNTPSGATLEYDNSQITITFERYMDINTLNTNTIVLSSAQASSYSIKVLAKNMNRIILEPIDNLLADVIYTLTITDDVKYADKNNFAEHSFSITGTYTPPPDDLKVVHTELLSVNFTQETITFLLTFSDTVSITAVSNANYITKSLLYIQSKDNGNKYIPEKLTRLTEKNNTV